MQHWPCGSESIIALLHYIMYVQCYTVHSCSLFLSPVLYRRRWIFPWTPPLSVWGLPSIWLGQTGTGRRLERFQRDDWGGCFTVLPLMAKLHHIHLTINIFNMDRKVCVYCSLVELHIQIKYKILLVGRFWEPMVMYGLMVWWSTTSTGRPN